MNNLRIQLDEKFELTESQIDAVFARFTEIEIEQALKWTVFRSKELFKTNLRLAKKKGLNA